MITDEPARDSHAARAVIPAEIVDAITGSIVLRTSAAARADVICSLVEEMYASVEWMHQSQGPGHELHGLRDALLAVREHRRRLTEPGTIGGPSHRGEDAGELAS